MATNSKLLKLDAPEVNQWLYQSMLRSLMYAAIRTHPDIMYAVHALSQFSIAPGHAHLTAIKHVYRYLNGTQDLGLMFHGNQLKEALTIYCDSDWGGDLNSCKSVSRYAFILCVVRKSYSYSTFTTTWDVHYHFPFPYSLTTSLPLCWLKT